MISVGGRTACSTIAADGSDEVRQLSSALGTLLLAGCLSSTDTSKLLPVGTPFVVKGTMSVSDENGGPCPAFIAENGINYYLFQDPLLDNASFDTVATPGATSRLVLATRDDLSSPCSSLTVAEVQQVLQVIYDPTKKSP